ncbi:hypothetical protein GCM10028781_33320 [Nostocoides australiense]
MRRARPGWPGRPRRIARETHPLALSMTADGQGAVRAKAALAGAEIIASPQVRLPLVLEN